MKKLIPFLLIAIIFTACTIKKEVSLYYYKQALDPETTCTEEAFVPIKATIKNSENIYFDTIATLIEGDLSQEEKAQGFTTEFPNPDFKLLKADLNEQGTLTLDFTVVPGFTDGGSMRMKIFRTQIEKTAKQFPEVKEVEFENPEIFQP